MDPILSRARWLWGGALLAAAACTGAPSTSPDDPEGPSEPGEIGSQASEEPATQIGSGGTEPTCADDPLSAADLLPSGESIGDVLDLVRPPETIAPTWFDGRSAGLLVDVAVRADAIEGDLSDDRCPVIATFDAALTSDDGAIALSFEDRASLEPDGVSVALRADDGEWAGGLDLASLHAVDCEGGTFTATVRYTPAGWEGEVRHDCHVPLSRTSGDFTTPDDTGLLDTGAVVTTDTDGADGTDTGGTDTDGTDTDGTDTDGTGAGSVSDTETGTVGPDYDLDTVVIASWSVSP